MKLNLTKPLLDVDGEATGEPLNKQLSAMLKASRDGDAIKYLDWAISLHGGKELELDTADFEHLRDFIKSTPTAPNLIKGRLLKEMLEQRDAQKSA